MAPRRPDPRGGRVRLRDRRRAPRCPHARVGVSLAGLERHGARARRAAAGRAPPRDRGADLGVALPHVPSRRARGPAARRCRPTHRFRDPAAGAPGTLPTGGRRRVRSSTSASAAWPGRCPSRARSTRRCSRPPPSCRARTADAGQRDADLDALGPAPANLRVERWVPRPRCSPRPTPWSRTAASGTTLGAVAAGLPLVVVPLFGDQPDNARRIEAVRAGVVVWPDPDGPPRRSRSIDPARLREAVTTVLEESGLRRVAAELAAEMAGPAAGRRGAGRVRTLVRATDRLEVGDSRPSSRAARTPLPSDSAQDLLHPVHHRVRSLRSGMSSRSPLRSSRCAPGSFGAAQVAERDVHPDVVADHRDLRRSARPAARRSRPPPPATACRPRSAALRSRARSPPSPSPRG